MITLENPNYQAEAERQRREIKARQHALFHEFCDLTMRHTTVTNALDLVIGREWRELQSHRKIERLLYSDYATKAARRGAVVHERALRQLLGVRGALRRVERDLARRAAAREKEAGS